MYVLYVCIGKVKEQIFVTKNVNLHQQHGISLASAEALFHKYIRYSLICFRFHVFFNACPFQRGVTGGFSFATAFLAKPFTVNGYKVFFSEHFFFHGSPMM